MDHHDRYSVREEKGRTKKGRDRTREMKADSCVSGHFHGRDHVGPVSGPATRGRWPDTKEKKPIRDFDRGAAPSPTVFIQLTPEQHWGVYRR